MFQVPPPKQFFLETPPWQEFAVGHEGFVDVLRLQFYLGTLDTYCLDCARESVFQSAAEPLREPVGAGAPRALTVDDLLDGKIKAYPPFNARLTTATGPFTLDELEPFVREDRVFQSAFSCTRDAQHMLFFFFRLRKDRIAKVGQSPSLADLHLPESRKYRKLLGDERFREQVKAIGLHAHGVGIGAFVYLRRVFEDLISTAHQDARKAPGWDQGSFGRCRMDEKIFALKERLPGFLVENRGIYSILSRGVHDLSEQDCLDFFEPVRAGIELILDEKLGQLERDEKIASTAKALAKIKGQTTPQRASQSA
jgi:hypothetical protein